MVFTIVASNEITHHKQATARQQLENQSIASSPSSEHQLNNFPIGNLEKAILPSPVITPTSSLILTDQQRFLTTITGKLLIPQPGTYEYTLLRAYGAAFVNQQPAIKLPPKVRFTSDLETKQFQTTLTMSKVNNTSDCYLQKSAADAFHKARSLTEIPLKSGYGASDCTRTFAANLRFWRKYANDSTLAKVQQGKETEILGTVAPPGASQHLWGLAIDLGVTNDVQIQALNQNGWFRTVENDIPHWTYLGLLKENLPQFGFKNKVVGGITYWLTPL